VSMCHGSRSVRLRGDVSLRMMKLLTIIPSPMTNFVAPNHQHRQTPNALGEYGRSRSSRGESLVLRRTCSREQLALVPVNFIFYKSFQTWTLWTSLEALPVLAKLSGLRLAEFWVQGVGEEEAIQGWTVCLFLWRRMGRGSLARFYTKVGFPRTLAAEPWEAEYHSGIHGPSVACNRRRL
jgi:hypothetical protein